MNGWVKNSCLVLVCLFLWQARVEAKQLAVVVAKTNATSALTAADLAKLFKLDGAKWPDGKNVTLVFFDPSSADMQIALQKIYKMQPDEFKTWMASHRASILFVHSEEELLKAVESVPGAVGLIDVYSITNRINVVKVDGKLPLEQGYLLRGN